MAEGAVRLGAAEHLECVLRAEERIDKAVQAEARGKPPAHWDEGQDSAVVRGLDGTLSSKSVKAMSRYNMVISRDVCPSSFMMAGRETAERTISVAYVCRLCRMRHNAEHF